MKKTITTIAGILAVALFTVTRAGIPFAEAAFDETEAVHIHAGEIEDATLAVGTHLISLDAMNDTLYGIALQSAEESGQQKVYYKSELGDGGWYDISGSSSLDAVLPEGDAAEDAVIQELFFTHHTKSDGITYDLRTGQSVNLFDIVPPYDVDKLPELDPFRNQYQALEKRQADTGLLDAFLEQERGREPDADMLLCDTQLSRLQSFYQSLAGSGSAQSALEPVLGTMEKIDAQRRFASYARVKDGLEALMDNVANDKELGGDADLQQALGECLSKIQSRLDELEGRRREEGESALSRTEYQLEQELLESLEDGTGEAILKELSVLYHIRAGSHGDLEQEKAFLDERLLPAAKQRFETEGGSIAENEWKYYEALREGLDAKEPEDPETVRLSAQLEHLKAERWNALDEQDLTKASALEQQFLEASASLGLLEQDGIYGPQSMTAKIQEKKEEALEAIHTPEGSLEEIRAYVEGMQALCALFPKAAVAALEEMSEEMQIVQDSQEGPAVYDALIRQCGETLEAYADTGWDQERILDTMMQEIGCVATESGIEGSLYEQNLALCVLSSYCGQSQEEEAYALLGQLTAALAGQEEGGVFQIWSVPGDGGADNVRERYVPSDKVAAWRSYRYVWDESRRTSVLAHGSRYYQFTALDGSVLREKGKTDTLPAPALFCGTVCIPESYVEQEFSCSIQELAGTGYGILVDKPIQERAARICGMLL